MNDRVSIIAFVPRCGLDRLSAWLHCRRHWEWLGFERIECKADESDYWKAAVAHAAASAASGDILIFADADCLVDHRALSDCIQMIAHGDADVASPKTITQRLTEDETKMVRRGGIPGKALGIPAYKSQDCGGVFAVSREFWQRTGGMDRRFRGWGGEDGAYGAVCRSIGRVYRSDSVMYHLYHDPQPTKADNAYSTKAENNALHIQYLDAERAGTMAAMLSERPEIQINYEVQCDTYQ